MKKKIKEDVLNSYVHCLHKVESGKYDTQRFIKMIEDIEKKYTFSKDDIKKCQAIKKLRKRYKNIEKTRNNIINYSPKKKNKNFTYKPNIQRIYHTIETEKMNAADMYNVMNALKTQINLSIDKDNEEDRLLKHYKKIFKDMGGIHELEALKNLLLSLGVNIYE